MRATKILMIGLAAMIAAATTGAHAAAPSTGSPLVGAFCSASAPIVGVGASFATNAHNNAFIPAYDANCPAGAGKVTYTGGGSGVGKQAACNRSNLLAGSDDPLTPTEYAQYTSDTGSAQDPNRPCAGHSGAQASPLQHIPLAVGAVTASYNLDRDALGNTICGIKNEQLKLRSTELALIFSGLVTNWDDEDLRLGGDNAVLAGCHKPITIAVRSDVSGTTYVFKDYLSKRNPWFDSYKQPDSNLVWPYQDFCNVTVYANGQRVPTGVNVFTSAGAPCPTRLVRGSGNGGVADQVKANPGAIGYVEYSVAKAKGLTWALVDGVTGQFNNPNPANCEDAATGGAFPPSTLAPGWDTLSLTDTANPLAYPICAVTFALVYNNLHQAFPNATQAQAQTLVDYLAVAVDNLGQSRLNAAGYAKLPAQLQAEAKAGLATLVWE